jgi:hypothetical protein
MRAAFFILAILFGFTSVGSAAEDDKTKKLKEKPIQLPSVEFNGYSGRLTADQSRIWDSPDPSSQYQMRQSGSQPYFGLSFSRPLQ